MNSSISCKAKIIQTFVALIVLVGCKRVEPPEDIKINPNPSQKYLVTTHFDNAIDIRDVMAIKRYSVINISKCSPIDQGRSLGGSYNLIEKPIRSKLVPVDHNKFQILYYPQMYLDEAYYSMDICHWKGFGIEYRFIKNNVLYSFSIKDSEITQGGQVIIQCESLKKNRTDGISQTCKSHEPHEFSMIDAYFVVTINSRNISK